MDLGLKDRVFIVTGGGSGIGAAVSEVLAEEGAVPVILARRPPDAGWLAGLPAAEFVQADLSDDAQCRSAVALVRGRHARIDGLVNNAGANDSVGIDAGPRAFRDSLNRNLVHYYTLVHLLADDLRAAKGAIVNVSSKTALTGQGNTSAYVAAKAAQLGGRLSAGRGPGQCRDPGRSHDPALRQLAENIRRSRSAACRDNPEHPAWPPHDDSAGNCRCSRLSAVASVVPYNRAMGFSGWRLYPS